MSEVIFCTWEYIMLNIADKVSKQIYGFGFPSKVRCTSCYTVQLHPLGKGIIKVWTRTGIQTACITIPNDINLDNKYSNGLM